MKYYSEETVKNMLKDTRVEILTRNKYGYLENDCRIVRPKVEDYPSIEISEPHGRLGDLDKTRKQIEDSIETVAKSKGFVDGGELWKIVNKCFDEAPTILEATE